MHLARKIARIFNNRYHFDANVHRTKQIEQNKVGRNFSRKKLLVGHIVILKDFSHFWPTNNFAYFENSKYEQISILQDSDCIFSRKKLKKWLIHKKPIFYFSVAMSYSSSTTNLSSSCVSFIKSSFVFLLGFTTFLSLSDLGMSLIKGVFFSSFWDSRPH